MRLAFGLTALFVPVTQALSAEAVTKIDTFTDWSLYADAKSPLLFCFVTSESKSSDPKGATRDAPYLYISAWPKDGVKTEISFRMGFFSEGRERAERQHR